MWSHRQTRQKKDHVVRNLFRITPLADLQSLSIKEKREDGSIEWTDELESLFFQSFMSSPNCSYKPVGVNKHFNMLIAHHRFTTAIGRDIDVSHLWAKLESMYDLDALDEDAAIPFPNEDADFTLNYSEFHQIISEKMKDGQRSRDPNDPDGTVSVKREEKLAAAKGSSGVVANSTSNNRKISTTSHSSNEVKKPVQ